MLSPEEEEMELDPEAGMDDKEVEPPDELIERAVARARERGHSGVCLGDRAVKCPQYI